jgi:hypothetical protein
MVMALVTCRVSDAVTTDWKASGLPYVLNKNLRKEHTYIVVFSPTQDKPKEALTTNKKVNVLFQSTKAVNRINGHGTNPRNTVVVFELK